MRRTCGLAFALCLILMGASQPASSQQAPTHPGDGPEPVSTVAAPEQDGTPSRPPVERTPSSPPQVDSSAPASAPKASVSAPPKKLHAASASAAKKRRKRMVQTQSTEPRKIVVREGGASEPAAQIAPGMSPEETTRRRQNTVQWLGSADGQLKQLAGRRLDAQQQETVGQIHNYMDGARSALKDGDVGRASNLAEKAHLLSDDLVNH
jgi:hypothetical protein